jgi:hypothetical protein
MSQQAKRRRSNGNAILGCAETWIGRFTNSWRPSRAGAYLAVVPFRTVFDTSAADSTYYDELPKQIAIALQHVADEISLETGP